MMGFIDHEEVESIPQPVHVPVRALEGGYRHRRKVAEAISKASELVGVDGANLSEPLLKENKSRYQAKRAQSGLRHRRQGDARLSAPGRQNDQPSPPAQLPGAKRCFLIRPQSDGGPAARRGDETARVLRSGRVPEWNPIREWDPSSTEILHHFDVPTGGRSICLYTGIPEEAAHIGEVDVLRRVRNQHGAAIEHEPHGRRAPATRMPDCSVDPRGRRRRPSPSARAPRRARPPAAGGGAAGSWPTATALESAPAAPPAALFAGTVFAKPRRLARTVLKIARAPIRETKTATAFRTRWSWLWRSDSSPFTACPSTRGATTCGTSGGTSGGGTAAVTTTTLLN